MIRSVLAVLAGIATLTATSFAIEAIANRLLPAALHHNVWTILFGYAYTSLCVVAGGYVTAWLASRSPVRHAVIMGAIQAALVIPAMLAYPEQAPVLQWIIGMVLIVPAAWYGGRLRANAEVHVRAV